MRKRKKRNIQKVSAQFVGRAQMSREGFIFVIVEGQNEDIFVPASKTRGALNGDTVRVAVTKESNQTQGRRSAVRAARREGVVVDILERSQRPYVGVYHTVGAGAWVLMQSRNMPYDIEVDAEDGAAKGALKGMKVSVVVDRWHRGDICPMGHIVDVLGMPGENETEMHAILSEYDLPYRFDPEIEKEAEKISAQITPGDIAQRRDFRDTLTFTIDPADAKDFDDALSFRPLENGNFEVGVHIADVSHYVLPGSGIDREARMRGTSVYLVDRTVPMLPEKLCNSICSLRPSEDKLTFSAVFEMSADAKVLKTWLGKTVIRSDWRLDYEKAYSVLCAPEKPEDIPAELAEALLKLDELAKILKGRRIKSGAIDFERPEMKVECDEKGKPVRIYQKFSNDANSLIEEFMLLANRSVAAFVSSKAKTFIYRVHDLPDPAKIDTLKGFAKGFGYRIESSEDGKKIAKSISRLLDASKGRPENAAFTDIALRAMSKAVYSTDNIGHYGLAFADYTHFTSPIRRYPDLMVHRLLGSYLEGGKSADKDIYEQECRHASEREAVATDAERASIKYKLVEFMQDHLGEQFEGQVSSVTEWGMYVEIEPTRIEGMIPLREMKGDFYEFEPNRYRLCGRHSHRIYRLGDKVRIRVISANLEQRLLDFELLDDEQQQAQ